LREEEKDWEREEITKAGEGVENIKMSYWPIFERRGKTGREEKTKAVERAWRKYRNQNYNLTQYTYHNKWIICWQWRTYYR
jgi:hypothetical protein